MLEQFTQEIVQLIDCNLAWVLALNTDYLMTVSLSSNQDEAKLAKFKNVLEKYYEQEGFPFKPNDNPLAQILLQNTTLTDTTASYLDAVSGGIPLVLALNQLDVNYVKFFPLIQDEKQLGVLVIGSESKDTPDKNFQVMLEVFKQQAVLALENRQLRTQKTSAVVNLEQTDIALASLLDAITESALLVDVERRVQYANYHFTQLTGYTNAALFNTSLRDVVAEHSQVSILYAIGNEDKTAPTTQTLRLKNDTTVDALTSVIALDAEQKQILLKFVPLIDEQKQSQVMAALETRWLAALTRTAQALSSSKSLSEMVDIILTSALEVVNGEYAALMLVDIDNPDELITVAAKGQYADEMEGNRVPIGIGITGWVVGEARAQLVPHIKSDPRFEEGLDAHESSNARSIIALPLISGEMVTGVLHLVNKKDGVFEQRDLTILESLSSAATVAIQNANLFDQTQRRLTELSTLLEASAAVTSTLELEEVLEHITRRLLTALEVQRVIVATTEEQGDRLSVLAEMVEAKWDIHSAIPLALDHAPVKQLTVERNLITISTLEHGDLTYYERKELETRGLGTVLNIPLRWKERVIGLVSLYHHSRDYKFDTIQQTVAADTVAEWAKNLDTPWRKTSELCYEILNATKLTWCAVYRWDRNVDCIYMMRETGSLFSANESEHLWALDQYPTMNHVISTGDSQLLWTDEITSDLNEKADLNFMGARSCLIVPLVVRGKTAGLVKLLTNQQRLFDSGELSLCQGIANSVGNALENASLYLSLEQRARAVESAYRELEVADQLKDNLLQNLSHEISTPLMHILGYISLLRDGEFGNVSDEQKEMIHLVVTKADHIAQIVRNMMAAYATRSGELNLKRVKLEQIAALQVRSLRAKAKAANIRIVPKIGANLPRVYVDQALLGQVFEALLDNALKFSHSGSEIEVVIRDTGGPMIEACVKDQGIGIPREEHEKIFMRFYQVHQGTARSYEGTGLGLSIVYDVIDSHGGKVWLESHEDKGTAIYFTVPKAKLTRTGNLSDDDTAAV